MFKIAILAAWLMLLINYSFADEILNPAVNTVNASSNDPSKSNTGQLKKALLDVKEGLSTWMIYAWDTRAYNTLKFYYNERSLPLGLSSWGFVSLSSDQHNHDARYRVTTFFTELRLTKVFKNGFGIEGEFNGKTGADNDIGRLGMIYRLKHKKNQLDIRYFPYETDGNGSQGSLCWHTSLIIPNLYFEGFFDYNVVEKGEDKIIAEPKIRYMFTEHWGVSVEYRLNQSLAAARMKEEGVALGIHYKF